MYTYNYLLDFTKRVFMKMGCSEGDSNIIAEVFLAAEIRNHASHGMIRIKDYYELYSAIVDQDKKNIGNIAIYKVPMELNYDNTRIIEAFEILQNYQNIENLNKEKFSKYARQFALGYHDDSAVRVLDKMKYKKSSIAFMKSILSMYHVDNSLDKYLNCASKYKIPRVLKVK